MAFTNALVTVPGRRTLKASIAYRRNKRSKMKGMPNLIIGIPNSITGGAVKSGEHFRLMLGDGEDAGKARLVRSNDGGARAAVMRGAMTLRFGHVPMLGNDTAEKESIEVQLVNGSEFELELPKWFVSRV